MTPSRAKEIIESAQEKSTCGPWSDQLDKVMSAVERADVIEVWNTLPGDSCFVDALYRIANGKG